MSIKYFGPQLQVYFSFMSRVKKGGGEEGACVWITMEMSRAFIVVRVRLTISAGRPTHNASKSIPHENNTFL
jgi:hypothetical protein